MSNAYPAPPPPPYYYHPRYVNLTKLGGHRARLRIVGSVFGLIPILSLISFPAGVIAVVFGLIARKRAMGKWGVALGVLALVLAVISFVIIQRLLNDFSMHRRGQQRHHEQHVHL